MSTPAGPRTSTLTDLARLPVQTLAEAARLPGSRMIPPAHALRACLSLKLWSLERIW